MNPEKISPLRPQLEDTRLDVQSVLPRWLWWIARLEHYARSVTWPLRRLTIFKVIIAVASFVAAALGIWKLFDDLSAARAAALVTAWQAIGSVEGGAAVGPARNIGLNEPVELLVNKGISLAKVHLANVRLVKARMAHANLNGAILDYSNLHQADLSGADLAGACLRNMDSLVGTVLKGANLTKTDVTGSNLSVAIGLTKEQVASACAKGKVLLPKGFPQPRDCSCADRAE